MSPSWPVQSHLQRPLHASMCALRTQLLGARVREARHVLQGRLCDGARLFLRRATAGRQLQPAGAPSLRILLLRHVLACVHATWLTYIGTHCLPSIGSCCASGIFQALLMKHPWMQSSAGHINVHVEVQLLSLLDASMHVQSNRTQDNLSLPSGMQRRAPWRRRALCRLKARGTLQRIWRQLSMR